MGQVGMVVDVVLGLVFSVKYWAAKSANDIMCLVWSTEQPKVLMIFVFSVTYWATKTANTMCLVCSTEQRKALMTLHVYHEVLSNEKH